MVAVAPGFNLGWQTIGEDVENPRVTVSLTAEQTIHGRVLDASGKPAAGAAVHVTSVGRGLPRCEFDGIQCWTPPSQLPFWPRPVTTDREGRFTLRGVDRSQILNVQVATAALPSTGCTLDCEAARTPMSRQAPREK